MTTTVVGACPLDCPDACSWVVTVDDSGQPVRLRGNPDHPYTRRGLCVKVNPYLEYARHPDRLMHPLRRVGPKGEGRFERISWEAAIDEIADRLAGVIDTHGGEAIWPYYGTGTIGYLQGVAGPGRRLFHLLGASRHDANICSAAAYPGLTYTTGPGPSMDPKDVVHAGTIVLWGANTVSTNQHLWPFVREAREAGSELVVIDPLATRTSRRADHHIAPRVGTDGALALGLMAHMHATGRTDARVFEAVGWEEFHQEVLSAWSAERAAHECDIEPAAVTRLAERMADAGPTAIRLGMGMQRNANGGGAARLIAALPLFTGDYARLGGGICYSTSPLYGVNDAALARPDLQPHPTRRLAMTRLGEGLLDLDDPPVAALIVVAANPLASNPDQQRVRAGLGRDDLFCVVAETFLTDTADHADIVLPSTMQIEHLDVHDSVAHLFLNVNNPVVDPPGECLPHTEMFRRLARAMGVTEPAVYASDEELLADALTTDHPSLAGVDIAELRRTGFVRLGVPDPFLPYAERFDTPSGRFELASTLAAANGHGRLPTYAGPREATRPRIDAAGHRSLALVAHGNHYLMNSMFANSDDHHRAGPPVVVVHPDEARARGLSAGDEVIVANDRGRFRATLDTAADARPGVAGTTKGHWPKLQGGATVNATVLEADADMARGAVFHDNQVWIRPAATS